MKNLQLKIFGLFALFIAAIALQSHAAVLPASPSGISASVDEATGAYTITAQHPAWSFAGSVGVPLTHVAITDGQDKLGAWHEISFQWKKDLPMQGAIRQYDARPAIRFAISSPVEGSHFTQDFPAFSTFPQKLHAMSYIENAMSPSSFSLKENGTPWFLFDDQANTAVLSAGSDYLVSQMHGDGKTLIASGLNPKLTDLPGGFTHLSWLVVGSGIESTVHAWGNVLTDLSGKSKPADNADLTLKYLGYWTDNGTHYYYSYDTTKGYAGTILALADHYRQQQIPIRYLQLDSWWYQKTRTAPDGKVGGPKKANLPEGTWNAYGGTLDYTASPDLFPQGLTPFQKQLNLPLVTHGRWIDPTSDYHKHYKISGLGAVDPKWWDDRMDYLKTNGVVIYEQDWLNEIYGHSPAMQNTLDAGNEFAGNMARAAKQRGFTLQYCMPLPRFFLQGTLYDNLTTIRTSGDRFERGKWQSFLYTSILADAVRIRPWTDAFMSTEMGNLTISTLSSGPVGNGDEIGKESRENLLKAVREDGVIIRPDAPLLPVDASIIADAANAHHPLVASTYTDNGPRTDYVFACTRKGDTHDVSFTPAAMGISGRVYVFKTSDGTGKLVDANETYSDTLKSPDWDVYEIAPVGKSGIAFLGDAGKIASTGRQRIASVTDEAGQLTITVVLSATEKSVVLHGYAETAPKITVDGSKSTVAYDASTKLFTAKLDADPATTPQIVDGDPVITLKVVLGTGG